MAAFPRFSLVGFMLCTVCGSLGFVLGRVFPYSSSIEKADRDKAVSVTELEVKPPPTQEPTAEVTATKTEQDTALLMRALQMSGQKVGMQTLEKLLRTWAAKDLPSTLRYFDQNIRRAATPIDNSAHLAAVIMAEFASKDPAAALAWAEGLPPTWHQVAATGALESMAHSDPAKAAKLFSQHSDIGGRNELAQNIAEQWGQKDPQQAMNWAKDLNDELGQSALQGVVAGWFAQSPEAALQGVLQLPQDKQAVALNAIAGQAKGREQVLATTLSALPKSDQAKDAATQLARAWSQDDPYAVTVWLSRLKPGSLQDSVISGLTQTLTDREPESALEWAAAMSHESERFNHVETGIKRWMQNSPQAARAWVLQTRRITEEQRARLLEITGR